MESPASEFALTRLFCRLRRLFLIISPETLLRRCRRGPHEAEPARGGGPLVPRVSQVQTRPHSRPPHLREAPLHSGRSTSPSGERWDCTQTVTRFCGLCRPQQPDGAIKLDDVWRQSVQFNCASGSLSSANSNYGRLPTNKEMTERLFVPMDIYPFDLI